MLQTRSRDRVFLRRTRFEEQQRFKVAQPEKLVVKNPVTGSEEEHQTVLMRDEIEIDKFLKVSDFALEVQLKNPQMLKDCGYYLTPSNPEEYANVVAHLSQSLSQKMSAVQQSVQTTPNPVQEPTKTE